MVMEMVVMLSQVGGAGEREAWEEGRLEREAEARARQEREAEARASQDKPPVPPTKVILLCFLLIFF